ncbi:protein hairy-like [Uloborus diversus]|uniref:protein hairy-like n=1 Tax=Uloborus diversus TaxID=327109 RepID=UPI0024099C16|nr:protein hairy-like [Uloborus diversus]
MPTKRNQDLMDLRQVSDKKASKPLMEKRRRARINHCLAQLKSLVVDPTITERSRQTKLEKADILELTVRHLHDIKRKQRTAAILESRHPKKKFEIGYAECVREVDLFLSNLIDHQLTGLEAEVQQRLKNHLSRRLQDLTCMESIGKNDEGATFNDQTALLPSSPSAWSHDNSSDEPLAESQEMHQNVEFQLNKNNTQPSSKKRKILESYLAVKQEHLSFQDSITDAKSSPRASNKPDECRYLNSHSSTSYGKELSKTASYSSNSCPGRFNEFDFSNNVSKKLCAKPVYCPSSTSSVGSVDLSIPTSEKERTNLTQSPSLEQQIALIPRRLENGEWALVLPANFALPENSVSHPFSAFRLVMPPKSASSDSALHLQQQRQQLASSPLSSTVSDMSTEEYNLFVDTEPGERMDFNSDLSNIHVWRPW